MPHNRKAAAQVGLTFGKDETDLLLWLDSYCEKTGATRSGAIKRMIAAARDQDMDTIRAMGSFSGAAQPVAPEALPA